MNFCQKFFNNLYVGFSLRLNYLISNKEKFESLYSANEVNKKIDAVNKNTLFSIIRTTPFNEKKYNDAKMYADKALKLAPKSSTAYVTLAYLAQAQGDKASAKKYQCKF